MSPAPSFLRRLPSVRDTVKIYGIRAQKSLSQNFLYSSKIADSIIRKIRPDSPEFSNDLILEVGPGPGNLTRSLLKHKAHNLVVVERDRRFLPILEQMAELSPGHLHVKHGDALKFTLGDLLGYRSTPTQRVYVVGNLPFSVASPLFVSYMYDIARHPPSALTGLTLMFQTEVARRICASAGSPIRSRVSMLRELVSDARCELNVPAKYFHPPPEVNATVIQVTPYSEEHRLVRSEVELRVAERLATIIFMHRQKTVLKNLLFRFPPAAELLEAANVKLHAMTWELHAKDIIRIIEILKGSRDERYTKFLSDLAAFRTSLL